MTVVAVLLYGWYTSEYVQLISVRYVLNKESVRKSIHLKYVLERMMYVSSI